jgi:hypothetical protein
MTRSLFLPIAVANVVSISFSISVAVIVYHKEPFLAGIMIGVIPMNAMPWVSLYSGKKGLSVDFESR